MLDSEPFVEDNYFVKMKVKRYRSIRVVCEYKNIITNRFIATNESIPFELEATTLGMLDVLVNRKLKEHYKTLVTIDEEKTW